MIILKLNRIVLFFSFICFSIALTAQKKNIDYVNPFIGTTNFGTTNPGAVLPNGLMSVTPFNVMGSENNVYDKDSRWWSTPYSYENNYFTGFSHVNLSGVGCPDLGSILLMATAGELNVDYHAYGAEMGEQLAKPGYYSVLLPKYGIKAEVSATERTSIARFTLPKGQANILLNLGEGLTNETGATMKIVSDTELEGSKLLGTFCYNNPQAVFPIYFVARISKAPQTMGYWKKQAPKFGVEAEWDKDAGKYKLYPNYRRQMSGDDIGVWCTYQLDAEAQVEVKIAVSFVSIENARLNMDQEQPDFNFDAVYAKASDKWEAELSKIKIEGGTEEQKTVFYSALYHTLIHPNILQDVNGEYTQMSSLNTAKTDKNRYTVFSLWDTYRNVHPFLSLVYPKKQLDMVSSMIEMYKEGGWLPKWELYSQESYTMNGDPSLVVINDTWQRGLRDFDVDTAYEAMRKSATTKGSENLIRPDADEYYKRHYVPLKNTYDHSVSQALEYYIADWNLAQFAKSLGKKEDYKLFKDRAFGYKKYYSKEFGTFRPVLENGQFYSPFNPLQGVNFEPTPGFHEGNAWNYTFAVPYDVKGLVKLMGGKKKFVDKLQMVFDKEYFDITNEPDIAYPYLFSYFPNQAWRTQKLTRDILKKHFTNTPGGLPGNDDTGTMSTWAIFTMMGFYPICPGDLNFVLTAPTFEKVTIDLDTQYYPKDKLEIEMVKSSEEDIYIDRIKIGDKEYKNRYFVSQDELLKAGKITFYLRNTPRK